MKQLYLFSFIVVLMMFSSVVEARTIRVPDDYSTIQSGVNDAQNGDTVLVKEGTYYENVIIMGKEIVLASYYLIDHDTTHISKTIIDGSKPLTAIRGTVLTIVPELLSFLSPRIVGLTITGGTGTKLTQTIQTEDGTEEVERYVGGGIYIKQMNPIFTRNRIIANKIVSTEEDVLTKKKKKPKGEYVGGGSYGYQCRPNFGGVIESTGEINEGQNVFLDNYALLGKTFYIEYKDKTETVLAENCFFDVYDYTRNDLPTYWAFSQGSFSFAHGSGRDTAVIADVYVSPNGSDTNDGTTEATPFKTLTYALSKVYPDSLHPITIKLDKGNYSPSSNGETFPIQGVSWVTIYGSGESETIIDAEADANYPSRVFIYKNVNNCSLQNVTLTGGYNLIWDVAGSGGGVYCFNSSPSFSNVQIINNSAGLEGGGVYCFNSSPTLSDVIISGNISNKYGGGLFIGFNSKPILDNVFITDNQANYPNVGGGGGIYCSNNSEPTIKNSWILRNVAKNNGGACFFVDSKPRIENSVISKNTGTNGGGIYINNSPFSFYNLTISHNIAQSDGGGFFLFHVEKAEFVNCKLFDNQALDKGGAFFVFDVNLKILNSTIANNEASGSGGGIYSTFSSKAVLINNIFWKNSTNEITSQGTFANTFVLAYNDIEGGRNALKNTSLDSIYWLSGNLDIDPQFINPVMDNYAVNPLSPTIDAGIALYKFQNEILINLSKDYYTGVAPDMGAIEIPFSYSTQVETNTQSSKLIELYAPQPNPFNSTTTLRFNLKQTARVSLRIFSVSGKLLTTLIDKDLAQGLNEIQWNGTDSNGNSLSSGTYFFVLECQGSKLNGKCILIR